MDRIKPGPYVDGRGPQAGLQDFQYFSGFATLYSAAILEGCYRIGETALPALHEIHPESETRRDPCDDTGSQRHDNDPGGPRSGCSNNLSGTRHPVSSTEFRILL